MSNDRVHACLDGELPREALTPEELAHLAGLEAAIDEAAGMLRSAPVPDFTARVMASLPAPHAAPQAVPAAREPTPGVWERVREWLWRPRTLAVTYRPGYALAGFAAAALAAVVVPQAVTDPQPAAPVMAAAPEGTARLYVQFRLEAPGASRVELAGSFTGWQPEYELREIAPGVWTAMVPLQPGVHDYTFVVDGEQMVVDPYAPRVADSFGGSNSRLFLPSPSAQA